MGLGFKTVKNEQFKGTRLEELYRTNSWDEEEMDVIDAGRLVSAGGPGMRAGTRGGIGP